MTFKPTILQFESNRKLVWLGHLLVKGIFDGEHCFELIELSDNATLFKQSEKFSGLLVPLVKKQLAATANNFNSMNVALKNFVEL